MLDRGRPVHSVYHGLPPSRAADLGSSNLASQASQASHQKGRLPSPGPLWASSDSARFLLKLSAGQTPKMAIWLEDACKMPRPGVTHEPRCVTPVLSQGTRHSAVSTNHRGRPTVPAHPP